MSPYLFVLATEILAEMIGLNGKIKGMMLYGKQHRISQYADHTTLFSKWEGKNIREFLNVLDPFCKISGLKVNVE